MHTTSLSRALTRYRKKSVMNTHCLYAVGAIVVCTPILLVSAIIGWKWESILSNWRKLFGRKQIKSMETTKSKNDEEDVRGLIENSWRMKLHRMPRMYKLDYAGYEPTNNPAYNGNKIIAWFEVKGRTVEHDKYPTYMVSLHKVEAGLERFRLTGIPAYLVVRFTDGTYYWEMREGDFTVSFGGRWVPRAEHGRHENDQEPVALIPMDRFQLVQ